LPRAAEERLAVDDDIDVFGGDPVADLDLAFCKRFDAQEFFGVGFDAPA